jgi:hypothetical protein
VCLDTLRSRESRRAEPLCVLVPDPIVRREDGIDPQHEAMLADSLGLALLVVLETLAPPSGCWLSRWRAGRSSKSTCSPTLRASANLLDCRAS